MIKSESLKRRRGNSDQATGIKKQNRDESPDGNPLEALQSGVIKAHRYAKLAQDPKLVRMGFDADAHKEIQSIEIELGSLELGLAARKAASYESRVELSSWGTAEALRMARAKGSAHDINPSLIENDDRTDHEVTEEAFLKADLSLKELMGKVEDSLCNENDDTELPFCEFDIHVNNQEEHLETLPTNPTLVEQDKQRESKKGGDDIDGHSLTDRNFVRVDGEWVHIDDFLGEKWKRRAYDIHNISLPYLPAVHGLKTTLREWQRFGVKKMLNSIHAFNGCILGDEMGMGKTLVCIVTALLYRQEHPSSGFTLVVTPKSCIRGWKKQLEVHFHEGKGPKTFVLEDPRTTAEDLVKLNPEFVLVTWGFLKSRFNVYKSRRLLLELRNIRGFGWLLQNYSRYLPARHLPPRQNNVLHSELYEFIGKKSSICFLDEAQLAKNQDTLAHKAVQSLPTPIKIPVTGSMVHNTWADAGGIVNQMSLGIFNNVKHFQNVFSVAGAKGHGERSYELAPSRKNHLLRLLLALTVSRPASLLQLPNREEHEDDFTIPDEASVEIALLIKKFLQVCHMPKKDSETSAVVHMVNAQKWASNQLLLEPIKPPKPKPKPKHEEDSESGIENDESQDSDESYMGEDPQSSDEDNIDSHADDSEHLSTEELPADSKVQFDSNSNDPPELSEASASRIDVLMHEEDIETEVLAEREQVLWNRILNNASDGEILSPRVYTVVQRLKKIIEQYPGEKIVIFSTYVRFLDIIGVALERDPDIHFQALRFDGSVDREERDRRATAFDDDRDLPVMMVSRGAGGVGMDLTVASHIIQCENWWNGNDELQAHFRCWRGGQTKTVHIWRVTATNSPVDNYIKNRNNQKMVVVDEFMSLLRRADEDAVVLPRLDLQVEESVSSSATGSESPQG